MTIGFSWLCTYLFLRHQKTCLKRFHSNVASDMIWKFSHFGNNQIAFEGEKKEFTFMRTGTPDKRQSRVVD